MIKKALLIFLALNIGGRIFSQSGYTYPLSLNQPSTEKLDSLLSKMAAGSKIIFQGESGSHFLQFYSRLEAWFLVNLNRVAGVQTFVMEAGSSTAFLCNKYLETGDTAYLPKFRNRSANDFWKDLFQYNQTIPTANRIKAMGVDFESIYAYFKALNYLLPGQPAPEPVAEAVSLIKANRHVNDCKQLSAIDRLLKQSLKKNNQVWRDYMGNNFKDLFTIISNEASCKDARRNRNKNLKNRFLLFESILKEKHYYAAFGQAHTTLNENAHLAAILNNDPGTGFYKKVHVVNTWCLNCTTPVEPTSNWTLEKIEKNIQAELLPYAATDLTLFDLSGAPALTGKYLPYGQFLLIAKNQH